MKLLFVALCAAATVCAQTSARITGRIASGRAPLRGEVITVVKDGPIRISPIPTDSQGQFTIDIAAGRVLLVAKADGYVSEERELVVRPGTGNPVVQFLLAPAGSVSGHVFNENGVPVRGARVWVDYRGEARRWRLAEESGGDAAGNIGDFTIPAVAQGRPFVLHAEYEGWLMSSSGTLNLHGSELTGVVLILSRHGTNVRGRVVDTTGNPVGGAEVRLRSLAAQDEFTAEQRASFAFARSTNKSRTSAADGSFVFAGVPTGRVVVTVNMGGRRAAGETTTAVGRETDITLTVR